MIFSPGRIDDPPSPISGSFRWGMKGAMQPSGMRSLLLFLWRRKEGRNIKDGRETWMDKGAVKANH